jgi:glyoxylase-like metal-dependent hydrolase (beta-lactamase superfamily II)
MRDDIMLIPLAGHTRGHSAVAVHHDSKWLLHAGDAYFHHAEIDPLVPRGHPMTGLIAESSEVDLALRVATVARRRELADSHRDEAEITSAHDPWELQRYLNPVTSRSRRSSTRRHRDRRMA